MPMGLAFEAPGTSLDASRPNLRAGCAAARSVIRRAGFTISVASAAARACLRGAHPDAYNRAAAAAWFRGQSAGASIAWPGGRAPHGARLVIARWSPGELRRRPRTAHTAQARGQVA